MKSAKLVWMSTPFFLLAVSLGMSQQTPSGSEQKVDSQLPPLRIAFIPATNPDQLIEDMSPVVRYFEQALGRPVRAFVMLDYSAAVEALRAGEADVTFISPLPYVMAYRMGVAEAILGEVYRGRTTYRSKVFVRRDSGIRSLEDLRGKTIAFVDPISSSGFMYPVDVFHRAGLLQSGEPPEKFFGRVYFAGGDEQAIRAVLNRFTAAAGVGEFSLLLLRPEERDAVTAIAESVEIPSHCVAVRKGFDPKLRRAFREATLNLNQPQHRHLLRYLYGTDGYVPVTHETFLDVERLARTHGFIRDK